MWNTSDMWLDLTMKFLYGQWLLVPQKYGSGFKKTVTIEQTLRRMRDTKPNMNSLKTKLKGGYVSTARNLKLHMEGDLMAFHMATLVH